MADHITNRNRLLGVSSALVAAAPKLLPRTVGNLLDRILDMAIDGVSVLPGARMTAALAVAKRQRPEKAIRAVVPLMIGMAGAQGFLTNLGGVATTALSLPGNLAALTLVQAHLVAVVAHLRGYDLDDNRVRSAIAMTLLGPSEIDRLVASGELPSEPMAIATAPVLDRDLARNISQLVASRVTENVTGKQVVVLAVKRVPLLGGGVGAAADSWSAWEVAKYAKSQFPSRRPITHYVEPERREPNRESSGDQPGQNIEEATIISEI